jgi:hypothetical protein
MDSESPRKLITLLWILINVFLVGLLFSAAFASQKQIKHVACYPLPPPPATFSPSSSPTILTFPPTLNSSLTIAPTIYNYTNPIPTKSPTTSKPSRSPSTSFPTLSPSQAPTLDNSTVDTSASPYYDDGNSYFTCIWSSVMLLVFCCGGTSVLRSNRTPFAIGMLAGVAGMMANIMLITALTSAGEVRRKAAYDKTLSTAANNSVLFFSSVELVLLSSFCVILGRNPHDILVDPQQIQQQQQQQQEEEQQQEGMDEGGHTATTI